MEFVRIRTHRLAVVAAVVLVAMIGVACGTVTETSDPQAPGQSPPPAPTAPVEEPTAVAERTPEPTAGSTAAPPGITPPPIPAPTPVERDTDPFDVEPEEFQPFAVAGEIDSVDFLNGFTHATGWGPALTVTNGSATTGEPGGVDQTVFRIGEVVFGDLDGDSQEEAAVTTFINIGGTGYFSVVDVYKIIDGQLELVGQANGGDRADGGVADIEIADGSLIVEQYGTDLGACCPTMVFQTRWALVDETLLIAESFRQRTWMSLESYNDNQELFFLPGTSSAVVVTNGFEAEGRFTFDARAGQRFELSTFDGPSPSAFLVIELASGQVVAASDSGVNLVLPANGAYEVVVEFVGERDEETWLGVSITDGSSGVPPTWTARVDHRVMHAEPLVQTIVRWPAIESPDGGEEFAAINQTIESYARNLADEWAGDEAIDSLLERTDAPGESVFDLTYDISLVSSDLVSIHFDYYEYVCCRPYPNIGHRALIVDLVAGRVLELGDVIDLDRLDELQRVWIDVIERDDDFGSELDEYLTPGRRTFSSLTLVPTGIEFGTDRGTFGGAAVGPTRTVVPFELLGSMVDAGIVARARTGFVPTTPPAFG